MKIRKNSSLKSLKNSADKLWADIIKIRDAYPQGKCSTCGKLISFDPNNRSESNCDAGHFMTRDNTATRHDPLNGTAQCISCNRFKSGKQYEMGLEIDKRHGEGTAEKLMIKSKMFCKRTIVDYAYLVDELKEELNKVKKLKKLL